MLWHGNRFCPAFFAALAASTLFAGATEAQAQQWIDAATGKPVLSGPIVGTVHNADYSSSAFSKDVPRYYPKGIRPDIDDPNRAHDPDTGRNFVKDPKSCAWIDTKTGKPVLSGPIVGTVGNADYSSSAFSKDVPRFYPKGIRPDINDPNRAYDPDTGRNFVHSPCPQPAKQTAQTTPPPALDKVSAQLLAEHNKTRAEVGSPPLRWDPELATAASAYARQLADGAPYVHAPRAGRENQRENLARGLRGASLDTMINEWLREKRNFVPGIYPNVSSTGDWSDVAHYTQIIWPTTTDLGCGIANGHSGEFMVCRYSPPGNADGKPLLTASAGGALNGFQVGGGIEHVVKPDAKSSEKKTDDLYYIRVRQDWGSQQILEMFLKKNDCMPIVYLKNTFSCESEPDYVPGVTPIPAPKLPEARPKPPPPEPLPDPL